jgi:hypothetical protein
VSWDMRACGGSSGRDVCGRSLSGQMRATPHHYHYVVYRLLARLGTQSEAVER